MGRSITRQQQVEKVVTKMLAKCGKWAHVGRTIESRITIARAIILSTAWYVLAALPIDPTEAKKIQTMVNNFINGKEQTGWGGPAEKGNMTNAWFYLPKQRGGWGLAPVLRTLKCRKLAFMKRFITDRKNGQAKPWHTFIGHMTRMHTHEWGNDRDDMFYWKGTQKQGEFGLGNWDEISAWWRDVWKEWMLLDCRPARNSVLRTTLYRWPIWNNRILASDHGLHTTLYHSFTNSTTRAHMNTIRSLGFTAFKDYMHPNGTMMSASDLYTAVTVRSSVYDVVHVVPQTACASLLRKVNALWLNTERKWLHLSSAQTANNNITWWPKSGGKSAFNTANNKALSRMLQDSERIPSQPRTINTRHGPIDICWKKEADILAVLAPSRRDLLRRLVRNALPVGSKRIHWTTPTQTLCMLCTEEKIETAKHLFWDCQFAKDTWGSITSPWRTQRNTNITWKEILKGYEVKLGLSRNKHTERMWAIVRACTIRCIWFERNRRYFYPDAPRRTPAFRQNQGRDDIKAHAEGWMRRSDGKEKEDIISVITYLKGAAPAFSNIVLHPPNNGSTAPQPA